MSIGESLENMLCFILWTTFIGWVISLTPIDNIIISGINEVFDKSYSTNVFYLLYTAIAILYNIALNRSN